MECLERFSRILNQIFVWIAGVVLGAMVLLTCANVFFSAFRIPVRGTFELMGYGGAIITAFTLGYTQINKGHIAVDILVQRFSKRAQRILNIINYVVCTVFSALVSWQIFKYGTILKNTGEVTETLRIIYYPFIYGVSLGCATLALVFLTEIMKSISGQMEGTL
ncbi:MAG TPA: TRAP transporter small permease [Desulfatiglandales bacterium]|nr:TRAP transporter small permease [Desulfatiglandales bacterium]